MPDLLFGATVVRTSLFTPEQLAELMKRGHCYMPAGSPEAEAFLASLAKARTDQEEWQAVADAKAAARAVELEEIRKEKLRRANPPTPKTGPQPWPKGTEFMFIVRRYKSGIFRVQPTPLPHVRLHRLSPWQVHTTRVGAEESACNRAVQQRTQAMEGHKAALRWLTEAREAHDKTQKIIVEDRERRRRPR